jgi:hypothetical protein
MFAIFAKTAGGVEWWVARKSYGTSLSMIPTDYYINRANAERDAEWFRAENARSVEATKRKPATYTVTEVVVADGEYAIDENR